MRTNKLKQEELHEIETQNSDDSDYCAGHITDSSSKVFLIFFFLQTLFFNLLYCFLIVQYACISNSFKFLGFVFG